MRFIIRSKMGSKRCFVLTQYEVGRFINKHATVWTHVDIDDRHVGKAFENFGRTSSVLLFL